MDAKEATNTTSPDIIKSSTLTEHAGGNLAAFYTPQEVAQILTDWAITDARNLVLDPSYGGCSFLNAAFASLLKKGSHQPEKQVFGVDIDPSAKKYLRDLFAAGATTQQYVNKDFFEVDMNHLGGQPFDAIVGNPPYIRYHDIPKNLQKRAEVRLAQLDMRISGRASYWAFFLLYSMHLLRSGGRLAMLLPGAILHTDYSARVRELLINRFEKVTIYLLQERIFEGTQEESVIICAEGAGQQNKAVCVNHVSTVEELIKAFENAHRQDRTVNGKEGDGGWLRAFTENRSLEIYDELTEEPHVVRLGEWVETRIGVVTGNNNFFIISQDERQQRDIPEKYFVPVIRRPAYISGLAATNRDLRLVGRQGKDYLLLNPPPKLWQMPKSLRKYIEQGEEAGVHLAWKCKSRKPWYIVPHTYIPRAFIPCMSASWPRVMVNRSDYTCTNNIIRLSWKERRPSTDWTRLALGTLSTLSHLSAELVGRSYGGGVLKLEPTELTRLAVPLVPQGVTQVLAREVDNLLRQNKQAEATDAVDRVLLDAIPTITRKKLAMLRSARDKLFLRRRQHRNDADKIVKMDRDA
jgi:methylase of polypeptide subunit release factors